MIKIVPLSKERLDEAIVLLKKIFPEEEDQKVIEMWLKISLDRRNHQKIISEYKNTSLGYFIAIDTSQDKIVGTTGLYTLEQDENEAFWLGWFGVDPNCRGKGIGKKLLDFSIKKAKKSGKKFLRLYTSDSPNELTAQRLYDKIGFVKTREEKKKNSKYKTIYKELRI